MRNQIKLNLQELLGCRLPPVRVLAHQLGISKNTVQTAYEELKSQGLVESKYRSGLFVSCIDHQTVEKDREQGTLIVPKPSLKNLPIDQETVLFSPGNIYLSSVLINPRILPHDQLTVCFRSVLKIPGLPKFHSEQGMLSLRKKIATRLNKRGINAHEDSIIITNGSQQALDLVTRTLKINIIATENPAYYFGKCLFEMNGIKTIGLDINPFTGINESLWRSKLNSERPGLIYLTTNFQNPNGFSYTSHEILKIVNWAKEFKFGILEDDWGSDILSFSEFKPGLRSIGGKNVLYMNSFTKKLMPSFRLGYIVADDSMINSLLMAKKTSTSGISTIVEHALFEFLDRGYFDTHLKKIQTELDIRYKHCLLLLRELMPKSVRWTTPGGGPILWIELPKQINLNELKFNLMKKKIVIQLSNHSFFNTPHLHGFKLGYAFLNKKEMIYAIDILSNEIQKLLS